MSNEYYLAGSTPAPNSPGSSAAIRGQFTAIAAAFDKLPTMAGSADEFVLVNSTGTALIASGYTFNDFVTVDGVQTLTNKTITWGNNTWPGFGSAATKVAGTLADNVLLLAEDNKLPALDASLVTGIASGALPVVPLTKGGTGSTTLGAAQAALGIDLKANALNAALSGVPVAPTAAPGTNTTQLATTAFVTQLGALKADANNAVLTGAPTVSTPPTGDNSARIANTIFVTNTVAAIGAASPSNATPLANGVASAGVSPLVSRDDHVHPASSGVASTTAFTPAGTIAATNVQAALVELDGDIQANASAIGLLAPIASPALTGSPTAPTPLTSDNDTSIATTAFVQSLLAQQPPGVQVSDSLPSAVGIPAAGLGVEASRYDHVHPLGLPWHADGALASITAVAGRAYGLSNVATTTVTLPATPSEGDPIGIKVLNGLLTNSIDPNGKAIEGITDSLVLDSAVAAFTLRYFGATLQWRIV